MNNVKTAQNRSTIAHKEMMHTYHVEMLEIEEITLSDVSSTMRDSDGAALFDSGMFSLSIDSAYQP